MTWTVSRSLLLHCSDITLLRVPLNSFAWLANVFGLTFEIKIIYSIE
jgi:hypothetical protein